MAPRSCCFDGASRAHWRSQPPSQTSAHTHEGEEKETRRTMTHASTPPVSSHALSSLPFLPVCMHHRASSCWLPSRALERGGLSAVRLRLQAGRDADRRPPARRSQADATRTNDVGRGPHPTGDKQYERGTRAQDTTTHRCCYDSRPVPPPLPSRPRHGLRPRVIDERSARSSCQPLTVRRRPQPTGACRRKQIHAAHATPQASTHH